MRIKLVWCGGSFGVGVKIVFTGGGTAGHIFPLLAIIRAIKQQTINQEPDLFYIGPKDNYAFSLLNKEEVAVKKIIAGKLRRYFALKNIVDILKVPIGFFQALFWLFIKAPDLVFSKGGYGSFPAVLAAKFLQIPIFLHESDIKPGLASRIESRMALEVFTSFQDTEDFAKEKMVCVGNPIRKEILGGDKQKAKEIFKIIGDKPLILILGGSQGAQSINNLILEILPEFLSEFELVHQTGKRNFNQIKAESEVLISERLKPYYHLTPFLNEAELKHILAASDLIVSRAGSGALFEIAAAGKPTLVIPLPSSAGEHQLKNGYYFAKAGCGEVIEENNLKPHFFLSRIKYYFSRPDILEEYANNCKTLSRPKSGQIIATYILEYLNQTHAQRNSKRNN